MARYRTKPCEIEAIQWTGNTTEIKEFCGDKCSYSIEDAAWQVGKGIPHEEFVIHTLEGDMKASPGDWIITGVEGEQYPCKPDIFEKTYQKIN